jgi:hypothetical protein
MINVKFGDNIGNLKRGPGSREVADDAVGLVATVINLR